jgi:hypothetical protein
MFVEDRYRTTGPYVPHASGTVKSTAKPFLRCFCLSRCCGSSGSRDSTLLSSTDEEAVGEEDEDFCSSSGSRASFVIISLVLLLPVVGLSNGPFLVVDRSSCVSGLCCGEDGGGRAVAYHKTTSLLRVTVVPLRVLLPVLPKPSRPGLTIITRRPRRTSLNQ